MLAPREVPYWFGMNPVGRLALGTIRYLGDHDGTGPDSRIEPLPSGGTHLVCMTGTGAETMRGLLSDHLITGIVKRFPFFRA